MSDEPPSRALYSDGQSTVKEPVDHILRPRLPWRSPDEPSVTECGYDASKVKTLTRAEYFQRRKDLGDQRSAMFTCMTCSQTAGRYPTWIDDPRRAIEREVVWECGSGYLGRNSDRRGQLLRDELMAIAALIEAHPDEFQSLIADMVQRREWLEKKAVLESGRRRP